MHIEDSSLGYTDIFGDKPEVWKKQQSNLDHLVQIEVCRDNNISSLAQEIAERINSLVPVLEGLCFKTCPSCDDPCCVRATVRYDFRDLVFLHSLQKAIPLGQPKPQPGQACSLLGPTGCLLPRVLRPFVCTWYLCPSQMDLVRSSTSGWVYGLPDQLQEIKKQRKQLETEFLRQISPDK